MAKSKSAEIGGAQLRVLLVGGETPDFLYLHDLLTQTSDGQISLDRARHHEEALSCLKRTTYDLVLCDYRPGAGSALRLLQQIRKSGGAVSTAFLSDHIDEAKLAAEMQCGSQSGPAATLPDSIARAVRCAINMYCKEKQRRKAEDMLRKLWLAVEQTADLVAITDRSGAIEYVNPAFETVTGFSREEAIGRTFRILKSRHQTPRLYRDLWQTILAGKVFRGVIVNRKKNGETFLAEKTITPLRDTKGQITHFISTDRDITERRRLEIQLHQAQKMDAIGRLAGGVAHDFNNLLMVIRAYAELMLDSLGVEHPLRRNVEEIITASGRAADLTRQLLAFGRKQMQALRVLDLNSVIQEICRMLPRLIGEDIQLVILPEKDLGNVKADPGQIEQVVMNLATNARDAMPRGGKLTFETANVRLDEAYLQHHSIVPPGEYVLLVVTDTGQGIAPEHLAHIFEPFYSTKEEGKGTGLGLATVYGIVKQNSGFVWVYSEPELGTTFKIYLPRVRQEGSKPTASPLLAEQPSRGSETLLLVEDEAAVRKSEREFLELSGYTVLEAGDGQEALRIARDYPETIHLAITDVVMPNMGGAKLAEHLTLERPQMKVLYVSGYAENTILQHGTIELTANFLQKPFTLRSLGRKISEVLQADQATAVAAASPR
jgi:two-component system cell cycle sensor histidine kinase/response regulator CckA